MPDGRRGRGWSRSRPWAHDSRSRSRSVRVFSAKRIPSMGPGAFNLARKLLEHALEAKARSAPEISGPWRSFRQPSAGRGQRLPGQDPLAKGLDRCLLPLPPVKGLIRAWGEEVSAARRTLEIGRAGAKVLGEASCGLSASSPRSAAKLAAPRPKKRQERAKNEPETEWSGGRESQEAAKKRAGPRPSFFGGLAEGPGPAFAARPPKHGPVIAAPPPFWGFAPAGNPGAGTVSRASPAPAPGFPKWALRPTAARRGPGRRRSKNGPHPGSL